MGLLKKVLEKWAIYVGSIKTATSFHLVAIFMFYHAVRHDTRQNYYVDASDFLIPASNGQAAEPAWIFGECREGKRPSGANTQPLGGKRTS